MIKLCRGVGSPAHYASIAFYLDLFYLLFAKEPKRVESLGIIGIHQLSVIRFVLDWIQVQITSNG
jgi:hypothetical protein